jgi:hypothetical protein
MTTASPPRDRTIRQSLGGESQPAPTRRVTIRWSLSRTALVNASHAHSFGPGDDPLVLECVLETSEAELFRVAAELRDSCGQRLPIAVPSMALASRGTWLRDPAADLEHIDVPGFIALTFRRGAAGTAGVLYARTPLLAFIGVPGGRYQPVDTAAVE